jgi:hypothetical protein
LSLPPSPSPTAAWLRRTRDRLRPSEPAHWLLLGIVCAGVVLRVLAALSWWPAVTSLTDSFPYAAYAERGGLENPQHPAGYPWLLALVGVFSRELGLAVILQHLSGIAAGLLLYCAVKRVTGSAWPALAPAAVVVLGGDQVFLEHAIMSEAAFTLALALAFYAAIRALDEPAPLHRWPLITGALIAVATITRSAGLFLAPVVILALLLGGSPPWRRRLVAPAGVAAGLAALLLAYALASDQVNGRFEIAPAPGWHLYARAAPFADCGRFDPPQGTKALCEARSASERPGLDYYLYDPASPARRTFGDLGEHDDRLGAFARAAILAQPADYLSVVWDDVRGYFVPGSYELRPDQGAHLEGQIDWSVGTTDYPAEVRRQFAVTELGMREFFNPFTVEIDPPGVELLNVEQRLVRFGATALVIATILVAVGLFVGPRRSRIAVLIFGGGGLAMLLLPTLSVYYVARYTVPIAGAMIAAAAISAYSLWTIRARSGRVGSRT